MTTYNPRWAHLAALAAVSALLLAGAPVAASPVPTHAPREASAPVGAAPRALPGATPPAGARPTPFHAAAPLRLPVVGGGVNVTKLYAREPAPIGIADYGIDALGTPTSFATPVLLGIVDLTPMSVWNVSLASPDSVNFALTASLGFSVGSSSYVYGVSDILQYSTRGGNAQFLDEVWNASGVGAQLRSGSVTGRCALTASALGTYYTCLANSSLPGNGYFIPLPSEIQVQITSVLVRGLPAVSFAFDDGFGWLTFETVTFPFAVGAADAGFVVDGASYRPDGKYLDAELSLGAPFAGDATHANKSNVQLELEYWNGHNLQEPASAFNVAGDGPATIANVTTAVATPRGSGNLTANVAAGPGGLLGLLWNRSQVAEINVTTSVPAGELVVNGTNAIGFVGGGANVTLSTGPYTLAIYNRSLLEGEVNVTLAGGTYLALAIGWHDVYAVAFSESGLPYDTAWSVTVDGVSLAATASAIDCLLPTGAHTYQVDPLAGFTAAPSGGPLNVAGANVTVPIAWSVEQFALTFVPRGLPGGTNWSVTIAGASHFALGSAISFAEAPATYVFTVAPIAGYRPTPSFGSVDVTVGNVTVNITWSAFTYGIDFDASGLPFGAAWGLAVESGVGWTNVTSTQPVATVPIPNGSFSYSVTAPDGYVAQTPTGQSSVRGAAFSVALVFRGANGYIDGAVSPASASVWVDNVSVPVSGGTYNVSVAPGPHDVRASAPGYQSQEAVVTVLSDRATPLNWSLVPAATGGTALSETAYLAVAVGAALIAGVGGFWAWRKRRSPPSPEPAPGDPVTRD